MRQYFQQNSSLKSILYSIVVFCCFFIILISDATNLFVNFSFIYLKYICMSIIAARLGLFLSGSLKTSRTPSIFKSIYILCLKFSVAENLKITTAILKNKFSSIYIRLNFILYYWFFSIKTFISRTLPKNFYWRPIFKHNSYFGYSVLNYLKYLSNKKKL